MTIDDHSLDDFPQGDARLINHPVAQELLRSTELARVAYVGADGGPRVFPMLFHWTGTDVVLSTFGGAKIDAIRQRPSIAVTIDRASTVPQVLLLRGDAEVSVVDGVSAEYALAQRRYAGDEQGAANVAEVDHPGVRMFNISLHPEWVGVLDFASRFPGGATPEEFAQRGQQ